MYVGSHVGLHTIYPYTMYMYDAKIYVNKSEYPIYTHNRGFRCDLAGVML